MSETPMPPPYPSQPGMPMQPGSPRPGELVVAKDGTTAIADPNAGTIAAIAATAMSSLTALASAYFGIKFATEQAGQANATAEKALKVAGQAIGNSTTNGNPKLEDF